MKSQASFSWRIALALLPTVFAYAMLAGDGSSSGLQIQGLAEKTSIKIFSFALLLLILPAIVRRTTSEAALIYFTLGLPIFLFAGLAVFSDDPYFLQAINAALFFPIVFCNWAGREQRFYKIFSVIARLMVFQVFIYFIFSDVLDNPWENRSLVGALGNANSFSLFCLASFCWLSIVEKKYSLAAVCLAGVVLSGSLAALIITGFVTLFAMRVDRALLLIATAVGAITIFTLVGEEPDIRAVLHAFAKMQALLIYLLEGDATGSMSVLGRVEFLATGLTMMSQDPASILWGHPGGVLMYTGDGYVTAILVTHGAIVLFMFSMSLAAVVYKGLTDRDCVTKFCGALTLAVLLYMLSNRILDYYPAALLLYAPVGYIVSKKYFKKSAKSHPAEARRQIAEEDIGKPSPL